MAWADVPAKMALLDAEEYADNTKGTTNSVKIIRRYTNGGGNLPSDVPVDRRADFEADIDYALGACQNLAKSRAINPKKLRGA